jgi:hypothetical protein
MGRTLNLLSGEYVMNSSELAAFSNPSMLACALQSCSLLMFYKEIIRLFLLRHLLFITALLLHNFLLVSSTEAESTGFVQNYPYCY